MYVRTARVSLFSEHSYEICLRGHRSGGTEITIAAVALWHFIQAYSHILGMLCTLTDLTMIWPLVTKDSEKKTIAK